jgi:hypothetical protein
MAATNRPGRVLIAAAATGAHGLILKRLDESLI